MTNDGKLTRHNLKKVQRGPVMWTTVHHKTSDQTDHVSGRHCETAISRQGVNEWMDAHRIALPLSNVCRRPVGRSTKVAADVPPPQVTKMHSGKS